MQVTLAITFMYLILIGYSMMGTFGVVFVSLSLSACAVFSHSLPGCAKSLNNRKKLDVENCGPLEPEVETKG